MGVQILVTKPDALNQRDKATLRKAGVVVVEAEAPADVKLISAEGADLGATDLLYAALQGADKSWDGREVFTKAVLAAVELQIAERRAT